MTIRICLTLLTSTFLLAGCSTPDSPIAPADPVPPPTTGERLALTACAAGEGQLVAGWSVDNGHGAISSLAVSSDGTAALAGADGTVKLWHIESGELNWSSSAPSGAAYGSEFAEGGPMAALSFDASGELIAAGDEAGSAHIFSAVDGLNLGSWTIGSAAVAAVAQGYDGQIAAAATTAYGGDLQIWPISGTPEGPLETELWFIYGLSIDASREEVIVAGDIYGIPTIEVRSAAFTGAVLGLVEVYELSGTFVTATSLGDGRVLAAGGGALALLNPTADTTDGEILAVTPVPDVSFVSVVALDETHFAAATGEGTILLGTIDDLTVRASIESSEISGLALVPGGWQLASAGEDGVLRLHGCES
jgi:WD40 repeat protein